METMLSTSDKVVLALKGKKQTRAWLAEQFNVTYQTISNKIENGKWTNAELALLEKILDLK
jgi:hypothetical protein